MKLSLSAIRFPVSAILCLFLCVALAPAAHAGRAVAATFTTRAALQKQALLVADGTVTATATSGAATLNKAIGTITSEALTTAAAGVYTLTLANSAVTTGGNVQASVDNGTNTQGIPVVGLVTPVADGVVIKVYNLHASQALNGTIKITFHVVK